MITTVHLIEKAEIPLKITVINSGYPFAKGVAYSSYSKSHLLNVTAGKMSAFPEKPEDFINWAHARNEYKDVDRELLSHTYLPRILYGEYLEETWKKAIDNKPSNIELNIIEDKAVDIDLTGDMVSITLQNNPVITANKVALATGNSEPRDPSIANNSFFSHPSYFRDSWKKESTDKLKSEKDILIIGNGLTMVDTVLGLMENGFTKTIYSVSPHGFGILPHRHNGTKYSGLEKELKEPYQLSKLVNLTHKHIRAVRKLGLTAEPIIDSLRPYTQKIWQSLTIQEKQQFLNRLRHLWGVARHRLPIHIHDMLQNLRIHGRLVVIAGKIIDIKESPKGIDVTFYNRKSRKNESILVERVINCTGPDASIKKSSNTLLLNLSKKGIATCDEIEIGIQADTTDFKLIDVNGRKLNNIYTLGANLRGMLWESSAVPELRSQAEKLSSVLINL